MESNNMNIVLWILQALLAAFFTMTGISKIRNSKEKHIADGHIKPGASLLPIRVLGVLELLGGIALILPWLTGILPILTPFAAFCFCLVMIGGLIVHAVKGDYKMLPLLLIILLMSAIVAIYRFDEAPVQLIRLM